MCIEDYIAELVVTLLINQLHLVMLRCARRSDIRQLYILELMDTPIASSFSPAFDPLAAL